MTVCQKMLNFAQHDKAWWTACYLLKTIFTTFLI